MRGKRGNYLEYTCIYINFLNFKLFDRTTRFYSLRKRILLDQ